MNNTSGRDYHMNNGVFENSQKKSMLSILTVVHDITWLHDNFMQTIGVVVNLMNKNNSREKC